MLCLGRAACHQPWKTREFYPWTWPCCLQERGLPRGFPRLSYNSLWKIAFSYQQCNFPSWNQDLPINIDAGKSLFSLGKIAFLYTIKLCFFERSCRVWKQGFHSKKAFGASNFLSHTFLELETGGNEGYGFPQTGDAGSHLIYIGISIDICPSAKTSRLRHEFMLQTFIILYYHKISVHPTPSKIHTSIPVLFEGLISCLKR